MSETNQQPNVEITDLPTKPREWGWWEKDDKTPSDKLLKLEKGFMMGMTDKEACLYAEISLAQLYYYQGKFPEFSDRKDFLKDNPKMQARANIIKALEAIDIDTSKWYLERKAKDEFSPRIEQTGKDGEKLIPIPILSNAIPENNSDKASAGHDQENQGDTGGNVSVQDNLNSVGADRPGATGQGGNPDLGDERELPPPEAGGNAGLQTDNEGASILAG